MDFERELQPARNLVYAFVLFGLCASAIFASPANESPAMHTFFDAGMVGVSVVLTLLLWDLGWRTDDALTRLLAVAIGVTAVFELFHILTALEFSRDAIEAARLPHLLRPVTWPPTAHLMPIGLGAAYALRKLGSNALPVLVTGLGVIGVGILFYFDAIPPYTPPTWFGVTRPSLALVPFLCLFVGILYWRVRSSERLGRIIALFSILAVVSNVAMLYSQAPSDAPALLAHAARLVNGLFLLFTLLQMGTIDTARRMRSEQELTRTNEALEDRVRARTADLEAANAALRETQQVVLQQERLRALGQMASGIAHDINNAISPASLYVESILARAPGLDAKTRSQLETVQRAIGDVAQTVSRMGEFYRQRETEAVLTPVDINVILSHLPDLTRARWSDLAQTRGAAIEMRVEEAPGAPIIMANESEIREALINLIFNAADALPEGGRITLRARCSAGEGSTTDRLVIVEVSDNGVGMDEDTRSHCLEPFFTTKGVRGTGLGLAMVYGIAQRHRAQLQVDSEIGKGTKIRLLFPDASGVPVTAQKLDGQPALPALRLLLVDDDPMILQSLRNALEYDGHEVACANGGQAGIDMFRAAHGGEQPFAAVITDLGMPHVDGRQVAAAVKAAAPAARVIMLTGWGQLLADSGDAPAHVDKILSKPPNMWELRAALAHATKS
jgi:signal transduction histidine kinase/ActR/RegA family two-component response regulator